MSKAFASQGDLAEKTETFEELAPGVFCLTAEGDPNAGVVVGDDGVMVIDARATPVLAGRLIDRIREVTDKPVKYVVLTHYHAVRVMGASAYGAQQIIASRPTWELIQERGEADFKSEVQRFPRLFQAVETVPGLTWPTLMFEDRITLWMGDRRVDIAYAGKGHTKGDSVVWVPDEKVLFGGDLVEESATPYCGDAYYSDWPATLDRIVAYRPEMLVPGRGAALKDAASVERAVHGTRGFLATLWGHVQEGVAEGKPLRQVYDETYSAMEAEYGHWVIYQHCMPFNVTRAFDEAHGVVDPKIWTAERDLEMWAELNG